MIEIRRSGAAETEDLRRRVLRPGSTGPFPGDDQRAGVVFFAAYDDQLLVATGNVRPEAAPFAGAGGIGSGAGSEAVGAGPVGAGPVGAAGAWRLRGMATEPARRGEGHGAAVLAALLEHCRERGGTLLWANARLPALAFYRRAGFTTRGEPWVDPAIGPHVVIALPL